MNGNKPVFWGYYSTCGPGGLGFLVFFVSIVIGILIVFAKELKRTVNPSHRKRFIGMIIAFGIGHIGAVDFLPVIWLNVYAFGYFPIFAFVLAIA